MSASWATRAFPLPGLLGLLALAFVGGCGASDRPGGSGPDAPDAASTGRDVAPDRVLPPPEDALGDVGGAPFDAKLPPADSAEDVSPVDAAADAPDAASPDAPAVPDVPDVPDTADVPPCACAADADCEALLPAPNACERAVCAACACRIERVAAPECCLDAAECDDGDPITLDACPNVGGPCRSAPVECAADGDCAPSFGTLPPCRTARCDIASFRCVVDVTPPPHCCATAGECPLGWTCPVPGAACALPADCGDFAPLVVWREDFDRGLGAATVRDWNEADGVGWHLVVDNAYDGRALYLGDPDCAWYFNGGEVDEDCQTPYPEVLDPLFATAVRVDVVSPEINLPAGQPIALGFWLAGQGEPPLGVPGVTDPDSLVVVVEDVASGYDEIVFDSSVYGNYLPEPTHVAADLSAFAGGAVRITFLFDTYGPDHNRYDGWWLDDVTLRTFCPRCDEDADCADANGCTLDRCTPFANGDGTVGFCGRTVSPPRCQPCAGAADCADGDLCTVDRCVDGSCENEPDPEPPCCEPGVVAAAGFDEGALPAGWRVEGDGSAVGWQVAADPVSGASMLWFGDPATGTYDSGGATEGRVLTAPIELPLPEPDRFFHLAAWFRLRLSTEFDAVPFDPALPVDALSLRLVYPDPAGGGSIEDELWSSRDPAIAGTTGGDFVTVVTDLGPWAGRTVRLALVFETFDELENRFGGPWIDDLTVQTLCGETCGADRDCDDGDPCTADACDAFACRHDVAFEGCCASVGDCRPANACTLVTCDDDQCRYQDDGDEASCCSGTAWEATFEAPTLAPFGVEQAPGDDPAPPATWYATARCARSGAYGVAFGDPATGAYATGFQAAGSLTTTPITIPTSGPGARSWARFALQLDTEWNGAPREGWEDPPAVQPDALRVELVRGDVAILLWTSFAIETRGSTCRPGVGGDCGWQVVELDLTPWQGVTAQLRFSFDTLDDIDNDHAGVCLDDVRVVTDCDGADIECFRGRDCDDGDVCTNDGCAAHTCFHEPAPDPTCCREEIVGGVSDFEGGQSQGWEFNPDDEPVRWQVLDLVFHEGTGALYFGDAATLTFASPDVEPKPVSGVAYSPIYALPASDQMKLKFDYYVDVQPFEPGFPTRDALTVRVIDHLSGAERVLLRTRDIPPDHIGDPHRTFHEWAAYIGDFAGGVVSFEVRFDSGDAVDNDGLGVVIDDWRVEAVVCPP